MFYTVNYPLYVPSEGGEYTSRVIGYETAAGEVVEVFTEYGSVPALAEDVAA